VSVLVLIGNFQMRTYSTSNVFERGLVVAIPLLVIAWFIAVPTFLAPVNFALVAALILGISWVLKTTFTNAQPASSLAQTLHDADALSKDRATKSH